MSAQAPESNVFVDDIVTALTGPVDATGYATTALKDQMRRAAAEFDQRTAEAFARALLESLCAEQFDVRRLEALLILGLAHPTILDHHRISLRTEGRRLALLLESQGQTERARCLKEVIEQQLGSDDYIEEVDEADGRTADELEEEIATYLERADKAAAKGNNTEAIRWLQEIVALDRNRRDVARMIRDLRWSEKERKAKNSQRLKYAGVILLLGAVVAGVFARESYIDMAYRDVPKSGPDLAGLHLRLDAVDALLDSHYVWFGMGTALREQGRLRREIEKIEAEAAERASAVALEQARKIENAEAARSRGMLLAQKGQFEEALADLRQALELSDAKWSERDQVTANVAAIESWLKKSR
ncbi:MAG: tetratricopeptide repeat protein [Planctomycetes bacterium]|nr:tetratricopeptide repeat protein [Planctomycetota bacterium]